eukprot:2007002-Alexandrium_andersonii.AAC.1
MAVRRALGNCAATSISRVLNVDAHRASVTQWETKCMASLQASSCAMYAELEDGRRSPAESSENRQAFHMA